MNEHICIYIYIYIHIEGSDRGLRGFTSWSGGEYVPHHPVPYIPEALRAKSARIR